MKNIVCEWRKKRREEREYLAITSFVCSRCGLRLSYRDYCCAFIGVPENFDEWKNYVKKHRLFCPYCFGKVVEE